MARYLNLYARLVANTAEPAWSDDCWSWKAQRDRWGYGRFTVRVGGEHVKLMAHVALQVCLYAQPADTAEFYQAYLLLTISGLEVDHLCSNPACLNPGHHEVVTGTVNCQRRDARRRQNSFANRFSVC